ncbi:hypothetical protein [Jiangella anatolica]|uniref:Uncharacterized protein n=1 Tax=Jiangella anatolica TaxID=2670374 RepID=A0A2W2C584_9ACTN|nr:hypothetical protein [Jiangella anatolica]PZF83369.1 hypothetical protein C1I92_13090 [Jiangella anatolica]
MTGYAVRREVTVDSPESLDRAAADPAVAAIHVAEAITAARTVRLSPGQTLRGAGIAFRPGMDGVVVTSGNEIAGITLAVSPDRRAITNDTSVADLGQLRIADVRVTGQVGVFAENATVTGAVDIRDLTIDAADTTAGDRVDAYGVASMRQGALTVWNRQRDDSSELTVQVTGLRIGRPEAPVLGAGVMISSAADISGRMDPSTPPSGRVRVPTLVIDDVVADGRVPAGRDDLIAGGVLLLYGVVAGTVRQRGDVTTHGPNDMVIDNWGDVGHWQVDGALTSYGPSAVGVVNFGAIDHLEVNGPILTRGTGSRGFNHYLGHIGLAEFAGIETHGDGALGVHVGRPIGVLALRAGVTTHGRSGPSLVRGEIVQLPATALSVLDGGEIGELHLGGPLGTTGSSAVQIEGHVGLVRSR